MRSLILLACSLAGILLGAVLIGRVAVGCAVIFDSVVVGVFALLHDFGDAQPGVHQISRPLTVAQVLERARAA